MKYPDKHIIFMVLALTLLTTPGNANPNAKVSWLKEKGLRILRIVTLNSAVIPGEKREVISDTAIPRTQQDVQTLQKIATEALKEAAASEPRILQYSPDSPLGLSKPPREIKLEELSKIRRMIEIARSKRSMMTLQRLVVNGAVIGVLLFADGASGGKISLLAAASIGTSMGMLSSSFTFYSAPFRRWLQDTKVSQTVTRKLYGLFNKEPSEKALERTGDFYANYIKWGLFSEFPIDMIYMGLVRTFTSMFDSRTWTFLTTDAAFSSLLGVVKQATPESAFRDHIVVEQLRAEAEFYRGKSDKLMYEAKLEELEDAYRMQLFGISFLANVTTSLNFLSLSPGMAALKKMGLVAADASNRIDLVGVAEAGTRFLLDLANNPELTKSVIDKLTLAPGLELNVTVEILGMIVSGFALQAWNNHHKLLEIARFEKEFGHRPVCSMTSQGVAPPQPPELKASSF